MVIEESWELNAVRRETALKHGATVAARQMLIEALGDAMCGSGSGPSPAMFKRLEVAQQLEAEAKARFERLLLGRSEDLIARARRSPVSCYKSKDSRVFALDEWTRLSLHDLLPCNAAFAWDGGRRVVVGSLNEGISNPAFEATFVLRFNADVLTILRQGTTELSRLIVDRCRALVRSRLELHERVRTQNPLVMDFDFHSLGLD